MGKKDKHVDTLLDALVWMRRKAKRHEPVDDLIDALIKMRRKAKKKAANRRKVAHRRKAARRTETTQPGKKAARGRPKKSR